MIYVTPRYYLAVTLQAEKYNNRNTLKNLINHAPLYHGACMQRLASPNSMIYQYDFLDDYLDIKHTINLNDAPC